MQFSPQQVLRAKDDLMKSKTDGVDGVQIFDSGLDGPVLYLGALTHGNEVMTPAALLVLKSVRLMRGKVIVVCNNMQAAKDGVRLVKDDFNMNRLPKGLWDSAHRTDPSDAVQRVRALQPFLNDASHCVDSHSTKGESTPVKVHIKGDTKFADAIPITEMEVDIVAHQHMRDGTPNVPLSYYAGGVDNKAVQSFNIEAGGPHADEKVIGNMQAAILAVLMNLNMISNEVEEVPAEQVVYQVIGNQWVPEKPPYTLVAELKHHQIIDKDTPIARPMDGHQGDIITAEMGGAVLYPEGFGDELSTAEEIHFIAKPPVTQNVTHLKEKM